MPNPFRKVRFVIASAAVTALWACSSDDKSIVDPKIETVKMCPPEFHGRHDVIAPLENENGDNDAVVA